MIIETISGNETFSGGYETRILLFHQRTARDDTMPLYNTIKSPDRAVQQIGSSNYMLACEANKNHGAWNVTRYAISEKCFITVQISKKLPGDFIKHTKQLMLYCRSAAALQRVRLRFSNHPDATIIHGHIEGRFDVVPLERFEELGLNFNSTMLRYFDWSDEDPDDFYSIQVIEAEAEPMLIDKQETVVTEKGKTIRVSRPRRKVFIGK